MKRKFEYAVRTIDDEIVRDGLSAISKLDIIPSTRGLYAVRGGVAFKVIFQVHVEGQLQI